MNRDEAIQRAEVALHWANGGAVQRRFRGSAELWRDQMPCNQGGEPDFFCDWLEWRIKPEPLECWVWMPDTFEEEVADHVRTVICGRRKEKTPRFFHTDTDGPGRWVRMVETS